MRFNSALMDVLSSKTRVKIISFLINHKATMSEREMASILKISHMSVNRAMRELADLNLVDFTTAGGAHFWKVNRDSYAFKVLSSLLKGASIIRPPIDDLKEAILRNLPQSLVKKVILYGSIAKNLEKSDSDIDIFILVKDAKAKERLEPSIEKLSDLCFKKYGNRLAPYILTEKEAQRKKSLKIMTEINKGIQIFPGKKG